jgi:hypothetical protein
LSRKLKKTVGRLSLAVAGGAVMLIWRGGLMPHTGTMVGLIVAALTVALTPPLQNVAGGIHLKAWNLYSPGDLIEIGELCGRVVDIGGLSTTLLLHSAEGWALDGAMVHVPHTRLLTEHLTNRSSGLGVTPCRVSFTLTFASDWREAQRYLLHCLSLGNDIEAPRRVGMALSAQHGVRVNVDELEPRIDLELVDSGIAISGLCYAPATEYRHTRSRISGLFLDWVESEPSVDLAYPTHSILSESSNAAFTGPGLRRHADSMTWSLESDAQLP